MFAEEDAFIFLCLTALCLPKTQWALDFVRSLGQVWNLAEGSIHGAILLLYDPSNGEDQTMLENAEKRSASLRASMTKELAVKGFLTIFLTILHGQELSTPPKSRRKIRAKAQSNNSDDILQFNAATSVVLRRLALLLRIRLSVLSKLEDLAIQEMQREIILLQQAQAEKATGTKKWIRRAKVGAVAAAAGGALAITGGMAAPALATGLAGLGLAGAATFTTATTMATLLGAGGAGLGAYKMSNRTRGVTHFEFKTINSQRRQTEDREENTVKSSSKSTEQQEELFGDDGSKGMTVYICISGYLRKPGPKMEPNDSTSPPPVLVPDTSSTDAVNSADFFAPWGAEPPVMSLSLVLDRFYSVVAPEKQTIVPQLVKQCSGADDEQKLMEELHTLYGIHPLRLAAPETQPQHFVNGPMDAICTKLLQTWVRGTRNDDELPYNVTAEAVDFIVSSQIPWTDAFHVPKTPYNDDEEAEFCNDDEEAELTSEYIDEGDVSLKESDDPVRNVAVDTPLSIDAETAVDTELRAFSRVRTDSEEGNAGEGILSETQAGSEMPAERLDSRSAGGSTGSEDSQVSFTELLESSELKPNEKEIKSPVYWWRQSVAHYGDQYTLVWEPDTLLDIGQCVQSILQEGISKGVEQGLKYSVLNAVVAAVALPKTILGFVNGLDSSWTLAVKNADKSGKLLADTLMDEANGNRPVVLIGHSFGGLVIAACLDELAKIAYGGTTSVNNKDKADDNNSSDVDEELIFFTQESENIASLTKEERKRRLRAATIVRDVVIMAAPVDTSSSKWAKRRSVVLGRLVNVYNPSDWMLSLIYRYKRKYVFGLAGLKAVRLSDKYNGMIGVIGTPEIENYNVSDLLGSDNDYLTKMADVLQLIGIGDVDCEETLPKFFP